MSWYPAEPRLFLHRRLSPPQEEAVRLARQHGVAVEALERQYGVSRRTIYRAIERVSRTSAVLEFGDYRATFELGPDGIPVQVTAWVPR